MIDFDDINTIPKSIISVIDKNKLQIREELLKENKRALAGHKWEGGSISTECFQATCDKVLKRLDDELIIGFHCTKLINPMGIKTTGLLRLNPLEYERKFKSFFKVNLSQEHYSLVERNFDEFNKINGYESRNNMVWFLLTKSLINNKNCHDFINYYGGETITRIQISMEDIIFPLLERTGFSTVVSFVFKFNEIHLYFRESIVRNLIKSLIRKKTDHYFEKFEAEAFLKRDIKPEEILEIYYDRDLNRLKKSVAKTVHIA